jgi:NAD-dependent SIR2 family protein deacetylase
MPETKIHDPALGNELVGCAAILARAGRLLVITGAGVSAESGMPTYRGPQGEYTTSPDLPDAMSAEAFGKDRETVWRRVDRMRIRAAECQPNSAHRILAKWERENRFAGLLIATQNIDGLHQKAGSGRVSAIHGSLWHMAKPRGVDFTDDGQFSDDLRFLDYPDLRDEILRRWSEENHQVIWEDREVPFGRIPPYDEPGIRPNITLYDESYGSRLVWVEDFISGKVDVVLVIGCSGGVTILDLLLRSCRESNPNCEIININPHEDCIGMPHHCLRLPATEAIERLDAALGPCVTHSSGGGSASYGSP